MTAYVYGRSGQQVQAHRLLQELERLNRGGEIDPMPLLVACVGMDDKDQAFAYLHKAYLRHSSSLNAIKVDPIYDPLRADPRFQDLLRQLGLS